MLDSQDFQAAKFETPDTPAAMNPIFLQMPDMCLGTSQDFSAMGYSCSSSMGGDGRVGRENPVSSVINA